MENKTADEKAESRLRFAAKAIGQADLPSSLLADIMGKAETELEKALRVVKKHGYKVVGKEKEPGEVAEASKRANSPNSNSYHPDLKSKAKSDKSQGIKKNSFHNFDQRDYSKDDYRNLEKILK